MTEIELTRLVEVTAYNLHGACLVGNPAPRVAEMYQRMTHPVVGDLVLEISTIWHDTPERQGTRLGRLTKIASEPVFTEQDWAEEHKHYDSVPPIPTEPVWYLALSDGREFRWTNARFITVPTEIVP